MTVVVCGSLNMDVIAQSTRRPAAGETVLGATVTLLPGGKGLNQAVAAARLGAPTAMIGAIGNDAFGRTLRGVLADEGVDSTGVRVIRGETTGVALIQVAGGDNAITGASGANMSFEARMIRRRPRAGEIWLAQFETPVATTEHAFQRARAAGARTVLNMAPMMPHPVRLLRLVDIAVVNELELRQATGIKLTPTSSRRMIVAACERLRQKGVGAVIATLGARGAMVVAGDRATELPGYRVRVVDTTGAGDCFIGALAAQLSCGIPLLEAARFANAAAACCVEGLGAAPSMPRRKDVAARLPRA